MEHAGQQQQKHKQQQLQHTAEVPSMPMGTAWPAPQNAENPAEEQQGRGSKSKEQQRQLCSHKVTAHVGEAQREVGLASLLPLLYSRVC